MLGAVTLDAAVVSDAVVGIGVYEGVVGAGELADNDNPLVGPASITKRKDDWRCNATGR